jgi:amino acid transporter
MFACVLACSTAAARVLLRMAHDRLLPAAFARTNRHGTPGTAIVFSTVLIFAATAGFALCRATGSTMYDLCGSLSVFGFLTAYALVAAALPFARRALGQHSRLLAVTSALTVALIVLVAVFDLNSAADQAHARIPWLYLGYIALGLGAYGLQRARCANR